MRVENGKIVQADENELYRMYIDRDYDDIMPFDQYLYLLTRAGCKVIKN